MTGVFRNAKVSDKVWSSRLGLGVVLNVKFNGLYPLFIEFENTSACYTEEGLRFTYDKYPELYWKEPKFKYEVIEHPVEGVENAYIYNSGR